jgi:BMFP domain-containing protein YqiC
MQLDSKILADFAKMASGAVNAAGDLTREAKDQLRHQFEKLLAGMDLVTREEFDAVKEMAAKAREENESLKLRLDKLEKS